MRVLVIGNLLDTPAVVKAAGAEGVEPRFITSAQAQKLTDDMPGEDFSAILAGGDHGGHASLAGSPLLGRGAVLGPMSGENIAAGIGTVSVQEAERMGSYFAYGGPENLRHGFRFLKKLAGERVGEIPPPRPLPLDSIYTPEGRFYDSAESYFREDATRSMWACSTTAAAGPTATRRWTRASPKVWSGGASA